MWEGPLSFTFHTAKRKSTPRETARLGEIKCKPVTLAGEFLWVDNLLNIWWGYRKAKLGSIQIHLLTLRPNLCRVGPVGGCGCVPKLLKLFHLPSIFPNHKPWKSHQAIVSPGQNQMLRCRRLHLQLNRHILILVFPMSTWRQFTPDWWILSFAKEVSRRPLCASQTIRSPPVLPVTTVDVPSHFSTCDSLDVFDMRQTELHL